MFFIIKKIIFAFLVCMSCITLTAQQLSYSLVVKSDTLPNAFQIYADLDNDIIKNQVSSNSQFSLSFYLVADSSYVFFDLNGDNISLFRGLSRELINCLNDSELQIKRKSFLETRLKFSSLEYRINHSESLQNEYSYFPLIRSGKKFRVIEHLKLLKDGELLFSLVLENVNINSVPENNLLMEFFNKRESSISSGNQNFCEELNNYIIK